MQNDYIKLCKRESWMDMPSKAWMANFMFKELLSFFKRLVPSGFSLINRHLHILDGHGYHVTLEAIEEAQTFGLDMITLIILIMC